MNILALGDCNTQGIKDQYLNTYVEKLAKALNAKVTNLGHTMATTREGVELFNTVKDQKFDIVLISFGLTDSWETFQGAPYVLYFPDNPWRKFCRKVVKKYKKIGKKLNFKKLFGIATVVPKDEYLANLRYIITGAQNSIVILLETIPKEEKERNISIKKYNTYLDNLVNEKKYIYRIKLYEYFDKHRECYLDKTHLNDDGYNYIYKKILDLFKKQHLFETLLSDGERI